MEEKITAKDYQTIKTYALAQMAKISDSNHNDKHILRVKNNALKIIQLLNLEKEVDVNLLKTICLLHDFSYTIHKPSLYTYLFEGHLERRIIRLVLDKFTISPESKSIIIEAVYHHTHSFPFRRLNKKRSVYTRILQDADTLDFFDCLRIRLFMRHINRGPFKGLKQQVGSKLIEYGVNNLGSFLNFPILAKSFFLGSSIKCVTD